MSYSGIDKPALAKELEELRREIEGRLAKTRSKSHFKHSVTSEEVDMDVVKGCTSVSNDITETFNRSVDNNEASLLEVSIEKDNCDANAVAGGNLSGDQENEENPKEKENDGEVDILGIENEDAENIDKGTVYFLCSLDEIQFVIHSNIKFLLRNVRDSSIQF